MEDKDASQKALEQVEKATDSDRAKGEDLLGSEDLAERDANKEALRQVEKATGTDSVDGKDLLESDALRRQLDEAKQSLSAPAKPSSKKAV